MNPSRFAVCWPALLACVMACGNADLGQEKLFSRASWSQADLSGAPELSTAALDEVAHQNFLFAAQQYQGMLEAIGSAPGLPRSLVSGGKPCVSQRGDLCLVPPSDWTSGFFPGSLWLISEYFGDIVGDSSEQRSWQERARSNTEQLESQQLNRRTHDTGFMMYTSYGNGYRLTGDPEYRRILARTAESLDSRFNEKVGCLRSWDWGPWSFPVIIDNLMNLELLFWAARATGNTHFFDHAAAHADNTLLNHFRSDGSCYHVVDSDPETGAIVHRGTHQGLSDDSAWARGQAWALYGFIMAFRETHETAYLSQARSVADFVLSHPSLPADLVPYWDLNAPDGPLGRPRDTSAAAVICAALYELSTAVGSGGDRYLAAADRLLWSLSSEEYRARVGENSGFLLKHGVGNWPENTEIDVPLIYGDYYFLEANLRRLRLDP